MLRAIRECLNDLFFALGSGVVLVYEFLVECALVIQGFWRDVDLLGQNLAQNDPTMHERNLRHMRETGVPDPHQGFLDPVVLTSIEPARPEVVHRGLKTERSSCVVCGGPLDRAEYMMSIDRYRCGYCGGLIREPSESQEKPRWLPPEPYFTGSKKGIYHHLYFASSADS